MCTPVCVFVNVSACVWQSEAEQRPALLTAPLFTFIKRERPFLLVTPGSCGISENIHLPRTKLNPQRFFPVSDSRKVPALSSAPHIRACLHPSHFSSLGISGLIPPLLSLGLVCVSSSLQGLQSLPLSVPPSALAEFSLSLSLFSLLLLARAEQSGCQGHPSPEPKPREKQCWIGRVILASPLILSFSNLILNLPCSPGMSGGHLG